MGRDMDIYMDIGSDISLKICLSSLNMRISNALESIAWNGTNPTMTTFNQGICQLALNGQWSASKLVSQMSHLAQVANFVFFAADQ